MESTVSKPFIRPKGESWGGGVHMFNYVHWARHTGWNCSKTAQNGVHVCIITQLSEITAAYLKKQHQRVSLCSKFRSLIDFNSHARVNYRLRLTDVEAKTDKWCKVLQVKEGRRFYDVVSEWVVCPTCILWWLIVKESKPASSNEWPGGSAIPHPRPFSKQACMWNSSVQGNQTDIS